MKAKTSPLRHKPQHYSETVFGARVPLAEAVILEDYARAQRQTRSDVVRLALHEFTLRQQMLSGSKTNSAPLTAQTLAEQLRPLQMSLDEFAASFHALAPALLAAQITTPQTTAPTPPETLRQPLAALQQQMEQLLVTAMLTLRLQVNYTLAPVLDALPAHDKAALTRHLETAERGREVWSEATRAVYQRTGQRILQELANAPVPAA